MDPAGADALASRRAGAGWWAVLSAVALFAAALRLPGIVFDLPYTYRPDEANRVLRAFRMLSEGSLHPHWFGHPASPVFYLLMGTYGLIFLALLGLGKVDSFADLELLLYRDPTVFYLSARLWSVLFGVACVVALAELGRRFFGRAVGLFAAVALATQPLTVFYSKLGRIDTLLPLLALIGVGFSLRALESGRPRDFVGVGATAGVAAMTKYPGALLGLLVPVGLLLRGELATRRGLRILGGSAAALVGAALVASPYFFLDPAQVAADLRAELRPHHPGANGEGLILNFVWYLGQLADRDQGFGGLGAALLVVGLVGAWRRPSRAERRKVILVTVFVLLVVVAHAAATLRWARWMIPALPFVALLVALGIEELRRLVRGRFPRVAVALATAALAATVAQPLQTDVARNRQMSLPRTLTVLADWIVEHVPAGSSILVESRGVQLPAGRYELYEANEGTGRLERIDPTTRPHARIAAQSDYRGLEDLSQLDRAGIDYFVTSRTVQRQFREEPDRYADAVRRYDALLAGGEPVLEVAPAPGERSGTTITLYSWKGVAEAADSEATVTARQREPSSARGR